MASHQQEGSDPDAGPVAAVSLPGLYKPDRMPAIDPKAVGSYNSDREGGDHSTPPASRHPTRGGKAALKTLPGLTNKQQQQEIGSAAGSSARSGGSGRGEVKYKSQRDERRKPTGSLCQVVCGRSWPRSVQLVQRHRHRHRAGR